MAKRLSKDERRILKEDIKDLEWLINHYKSEGKLGKAADCEKELEEIKKKLKGGNKDDFSEN